MFEDLQVYDRRERILVGCGDLVLAGLTAFAPKRSAPAQAPERILVTRLERIGDLLMTLGAIEALRQRAPNAAIHLVVGSWNEPIARRLPWVDSYETLDVPWLARQARGMSFAQLIQRARSWRQRRFDLAVNLEPDIRSNLLIWLSGASRRVGFLSGGGGRLLTTALPYRPSEHTASNAQRLVDLALPDSVPAGAPIRPPRMPIADEDRRAAIQLLGGPSSHKLIGIHPSGGRAVKQWDMDRFAEVATRLARQHDATIVLTGTPDDRPLAAAIRALLPPEVRVIDMTGAMELSVFAAVLEQLTVFVSSDTGPMHLAAAVGTPVVALFGPSDPNRYGPLSDRARVVTADLWCRPCNRVRLPPERCRGRVPDCLRGIDADMVWRAAGDVLQPDR